MAAYWIHDFALDSTCSGYPLYVLVDKDLNCQFSTPYEDIEIMAKRK
ncbi:MAG: hypothetical protein IJ761_07735 [Bacteroidales bacterium]|nr:hypothetical protein [Bacteroidales bacterium]